MTKYLLLTIFLLFGLFGLSGVSLAATVTVNADTNVYVWGLGYTLVLESGSTYASMTVNSTNISFTAESGTSVKLKSNDAIIMVSSTGDPTVCHGSYSEISVTASSGTFTITPKSTTCSGGSTAGGGGGGGGGASDTTAPSISDIEVAAGSTTTTVSWTTSEGSWSWIVYGTSTDYGQEEKSTSYLTSHSLTLSGLNPETVYHYQIKSKDSAGNIGTHIDQTFTTSAEGEAPATPPEETTAKPLSEMTVAEIKAEIARITALIVQLQAELANMLGKGAIAGVPADFSFDKNLKLGMSLNDVKYLQIVLNSDPDTRLAESGIGSPGQETSYFGPLTKDAVIRFQEKYSTEVLAPWGFSHGTGLVYKTTRAKLNKLLGR